MDLHTIKELRRPTSAAAVDEWRGGDAWLAGGTWLFSEPQPALDTLIDLGGLGWLALEVSSDGLTIGATCRVVDLHRFAGPAEWQALPLFRACCDAFLASFKIWNAATLGGNLCMSLPAGPMISLTAALEGVCTLWPRDGASRDVPVVDFVTGNHANVLAPGELLRSIHLPASALRKRVAFRRASLTKLGRSAALLIGTRNTAGAFLLTITAATDRPAQLRFDALPGAAELRDAVERIADARWFGDEHGSAAYKRHLAIHFAEEIRAELEAASP
jgi:CO/xanthine dehydrogenase FAD-binding subunit